MRVIVCGGRNFRNSTFIENHLNTINITEMACGGAPGVDEIAYNWAKSKNIPVKVFPAEWDKFGPAAGPIRNKKMLEEFKPDCVIGFLYGSGPGTANMLNQAQKAGIGILKIVGTK